jgi:hypothetical protein
MGGCHRIVDGLKDWRSKLSAIVKSRDVAGVEWLAVVSIHFMHITTISGWLKFAFDPIKGNAERQERRARDIVIEIYVLVELVLLQVLLWVPAKGALWPSALALYFLYEVLLNLFSIVFVGKLAVYPPTASIERSLLLFGINVLQVLTVFAIFYRAEFDHHAYVALVYSALVFGTIGHPLQGSLTNGGYIVAAQIIIDFVLFAVFLAAFVGSLKAFRRMEGNDRSDKD